MKRKVVVLLFFLKIAAGVFSGWMLRNYASADTWGYHRDALVEYHLLFTDPSTYFTNLFYTGYQHGYDGVLQIRDSYWNDLKTNLIIKFVSVLHIFSFGNYYVNVVLYNFIVFFGHIALYKFFKLTFKTKDSLLVFVCFLLPSLLFFSSSIHKEGLIFTAISFIFYCFYTCFNFSGFINKKSLVIILCFFIVFLFRSYIVIILLPGLFAYYLALKRKESEGLIFFLVFLLGSGVFFLSPHISHSADLPSLVAEKQTDFLGLGKANTSIPVHQLEPSLKGFLKNAPEALSNTLLRPFITDYPYSRPLLPFIFELAFYQILFLAFLFFKNRNVFSNKATIYLCLFFSIFMLLVIGYTVPVLWAIVRYRSIYLPFILAPIIFNIDYQKMKLFLKIKK